jgi:hypothetical protein
MRAPTIWLSYQRRVRDDIEELFNESEAREVLDERFVAGLTATIHQIEGWQIKLITLQFAILCFLAVGFLSGDSALSLFGLTLKNVGGIREILMVVSSSLVMVELVLGLEKETRITIVEEIAARGVDKKFWDLFKWSLPAAFGVHVYFPKRHQHWILPTTFTEWFFRFQTALMSLAVTALLVGAISVQLYVLWDIYQRPTWPGVWTDAVVLYVGLSVCP